MKKLINQFFVPLKALKQLVDRAPKAGALLAIRLYQSTLSLFLGGNCRYFPSCSEYCLECFQQLPFFQALAHSIRRVLSCRPCGGHGFDPIPKKQVHN